jgi:thymidylate kinase
MLTVALIGGDGAGKTSIAKKLEKDCPLPTKYLYMGINPQAGEFSLPTSRLNYALKKRNYKKALENNKVSEIEDISANYLEYSKTSRSPVRTILRHFNRLLEAFYRQSVSVYYQMRGYIVIYDRHPLFDTAPLMKVSKKNIDSRINDFNHWVISNLFPKPKLSIYLDAPAELLYLRKGESTPDYLDRQRSAYLKQGEKTKNFICVDSTQPLDEVFDEVQRIVLDFHTENGGNK